MISSSPRIRRITIDYFRTLIDMAGELDADVVVVAPSLNRKLKAEASPEDEGKWAVEGIRECAEYAARTNKRIVIEPWNRFETYFMNRLDQVLKLKQDVRLDNIGVMADFFHMNIEESSMEEALRRCGKDLVHVHVIDSDLAILVQDISTFILF